MQLYSNNHRHNLTIYWRQFYPNWTIPKGYHVHHIKPKCTFADKNDPRIHHPRNLIALHPDDHQTIHRCRGDHQLANGILSVRHAIRTTEHTEKIAAANRGKKRTEPAWNKGLHYRLPPCAEATKKKIAKTLTGSKRPQVVNDKISKSLTGKYTGNKSGKYIGDYVTPWGTYDSLVATIKACPVPTSERVIQNFCRFKNTKSIHHSSARQCNFLNEDAIGRTPLELGFKFSTQRKRT